MAFVQFTGPDDQPVIINSDRIVTASSIPDDEEPAKGTRITFSNGGVQAVKEGVADVLRRLNISA